MMNITAYADRISVAPGETINFMVNCEAKTFRADFVKLICGDLNPDGPGYKEKVVKTPASKSYKGRKQVIHSGSYVEIPGSPMLGSLESFTLQAFIFMFLTTVFIGQMSHHDDEHGHAEAAH